MASGDQSRPVVIAVHGVRHGVRHCRQCRLPYYDFPATALGEDGSVVGATAAVASPTCPSGTYTVEGSGIQTPGTVDSFDFVQQGLVGNRSSE
jgi:hypothetical protein